jgi:hypothetical protein
LTTYQGNVPAIRQVGNVFTDIVDFYLNPFLKEKGNSVRKLILVP